MAAALNERGIRTPRAIGRARLTVTLAAARA
jgi:hypothetical protein